MTAATTWSSPRGREKAAPKQVTLDLQTRGDCVTEGPS